MSKKFGGSIPDPWSTYEKAELDALDSVNGSFQSSLWSSPSTHSKSNYVPTARCYESHPPLPLTKDGATYYIYGGSCSSPIVSDADIYIGFDYMPPKYPRFPWNTDTNPVIEIPFAITDMAAPKDPVEFKKMITWVCGQVLAGKKVHAGCIGGHGRTGTFLAAVVAEFMGEKDAITYVRKNYCKKAVESAVQTKFLETHYGITPVPGAKESMAPSGKWSSGISNKPSQPTGAWKTSIASKANNVVALPATNKVAFSGATRVIKHVPSNRCIWRNNV